MVFNRRPKPDQKFLLSHLGLFYALVATLFAVPLIAAVVVVLIKGIIDLRYVILIGGALLMLGFAIWMTRWGIGFFRKIKFDGDATARSFNHRSAGGEAVELSFFGGLFKVSYKGHPEKEWLPAERLRHPSRLLDETGQPAGELVTQLQALSDLKNSGDIDENEYQQIKRRLIPADEPLSCLE